jgi:hypothetical protein
MLTSSVDYGLLTYHKAADGWPKTQNLGDKSYSINWTFQIEYFSLHQQFARRCHI